MYYTTVVLSMGNTVPNSEQGTAKQYKMAMCIICNGAIEHSEWERESFCSYRCKIAHIRLIDPLYDCNDYNNNNKRLLGDVPNFGTQSRMAHGKIEN